MQICINVLVSSMDLLLKIFVSSGVIFYQILSPAVTPCSALVRLFWRVLRARFSVTTPYRICVSMTGCTTGCTTVELIETKLAHRARAAVARGIS